MLSGVRLTPHTSSAQGRYGNASGLTHANCSGICSPGQWCPEGTVVPNPCSPGFYCPAQSIAEQPCPAVRVAARGCPLLCLSSHPCAVPTAGPVRGGCHGRRPRLHRSLPNRALLPLQHVGPFPMPAGQLRLLTVVDHRLLRRAVLTRLLLLVWYCHSVTVLTGLLLPGCRRSAATLRHSTCCACCVSKSRPLAHCVSFQGRYGSAPMEEDAACTGTCPSGHYCPTNSSVPIPCPAGRFRGLPAGESEDDCSVCPPGTACVEDGLSAPVPCDAGFHSNVTARVTPCTDPCTVGHFCPNATGACVQWQPPPLRSSRLPRSVLAHVFPFFCAQLCQYPALRAGTA